MDECKNCSADIKTADNICPECGDSLISIESSQPTTGTNWISNFKYTAFFAALFWPSLVGLWIFFIIYASSKNQNDSLFLFVTSLFMFCGANFSEKMGSISGKFYTVERSENPGMFNVLVNLTIFVSLLFLIAGIMDLLK